MRPLLLLFALILTFHNVLAQEGQAGKLNKKQQEAYALRKKGKFKEALAIHKSIYKIAPKFKTNIYNYACLYGLPK